MEIHKYICDCCGKELDKTKWTISQKYTDSQYDALDDDYHYHLVDTNYHLCDECWEKVESLLIKKNG